MQKFVLSAFSTVAFFVVALGIFHNFYPEATTFLYPPNWQWAGDALLFLLLIGIVGGFILWEYGAWQHDDYMRKVAIVDAREADLASQQYQISLAWFRAETAKNHQQLKKLHPAGFPD